MSELTDWLKQKAHEASAVEGIQKDWLIAAAITKTLEDLTTAINELAKQLKDK